MIYEDNIKYKIEYNGEKFSKDLTSYKVIFMGRYGVGKTTIINKIMQKFVDKEYFPTLSIDIKNIQAKVNDEIIQINIWDSCGNDKFALNTPNLFKNVSIALLVYAIDNKISYDELEAWYHMLKENSFDNMIFLIGNKNDLDKEREVTLEEGETFKNKYEDDIKIFLETSSFDNKNIGKLLENIVISIYEKDKKLANEEDNAVRKTITLTNNDFTKQGKKKKKKCC